MAICGVEPTLKYGIPQSLFHTWKALREISVSAGVDRMLNSVFYVTEGTLESYNFPHFSTAARATSRDEVHERTIIFCKDNGFRQSVC